MPCILHGEGSAMITEFALFIFTTIGGLAAGFYIVAAFFPLEGKRNNLLLSIIPLVCLAIGGVALLSHLGHPERMFNAFANPSAGITQEGICTSLFGIVLVIDFLLVWRKGEAPRALRFVGALFAFLLIMAMGMLYYNYESMPMWHALPTVPLFVAGDLALGALLVGALDGEAPRKALWYTAAVFAAITAMAMAGDAAVFPASGLDATPFLVAAVMAAGVAIYLFARWRTATPQIRWAVFAVLLVAIAIARYAFYAAF